MNTPSTEEKNQCDGCNQGLELKEGIHYKNGQIQIGCTKELYRTSCGNCGLAHMNGVEHECDSDGVKKREKQCGSDCYSIYRFCRHSLIDPSEIVPEIPTWEEKLNLIWERAHIPEWANDAKTAISSLLKAVREEGFQEDSINKAPNFSVPIGISQWLEYGKKMGYADFFEQKFRSAALEEIREMLESMIEKKWDMDNGYNLAIVKVLESLKDKK